jgi:hypothetical protein
MLAEGPPADGESDRWRGGINEVDLPSRGRAVGPQPINGIDDVRHLARQRRWLIHLVDQ